MENGETYYTLENDQIRIKISSMGAELKSLADVKTGREYMWQADPEFWGRTSPILFPLVGNYFNKESRYKGEVYKMSQHGFARDMEFMMTRQEGDEIWFCLTDKEETWSSYPFAFALEAGFRLKGRSVEVLWKVTNPAGEDMYFSLGGHPAFQMPLMEDGKVNCYLQFDCEGSVTSRNINGGFASDKYVEYPLAEGGILPVEKELFAEDALVIEKDQAHKVTLLDADQKPYVSVEFKAPLFGVWSPSHVNAPFICIEPWYGRCDHIGFTGDISEREWGNHLAPGASFKAAYTITV